MRQKLFGSKIEPNCEYCSHNSSTDSGAVCSLGQKIDENGKCSRFAYDPLLRTPKSTPPLREYDENDFKL
jgi:hypothetical protein